MCMPPQAPGAPLLLKNHMCERTTAENGKVENENERGSEGAGDHRREINRICNPAAAKPRNNIINKSRGMALQTCGNRSK